MKSDLRSSLNNNKDGNLATFQPCSFESNEAICLRHCARCFSNESAANWRRDGKKSTKVTLKCFACNENITRFCTRCVVSKMEKKTATKTIGNTEILFLSRSKANLELRRNDYEKKTRQLSIKNILDCPKIIRHFWETSLKHHKITSNSVFDTIW